MRVGIDYTAGANQRAGIGRFVRSLVGALLATGGPNEYALFYARGGRNEKPAFGQRPNVQEVSFPISDRTLKVIWYRLGLPLPIDLFTGGVDVFHFPDFTLPPPAGTIIVTVHDLSFLLVPECADARLRTFLERVVPASVAGADFVTADSANTRHDVIALLDVPPERVEVVYGGVDACYRRVEDPRILEATRAKLQLNYPFILFVGVIEPRKNLVRLLQAYAELRERDRDLPKLVLAGGLGWLYQDIFREVEELDLSDSVVFLGYVAEEDLPALYSLAELFVFPSLYEGFGLPPLEAMACGVPVVCSNASSLPEVVGDAGVLVPPTDVEALADAIRRVLHDEGLRNRLRRLGPDQAGKFTWPRAAERMLSIYDRVAGGG